MTGPQHPKTAVKTCCQCGEEKPLKHQFFWRGWSDTCRACGRRKRGRARSRRYRKTLHDCYVVQVLTQGTGLGAQQIPTWLIEAKRLQIAIVREVKRQEARA
jgi:hypothetical protein